MAFLTDRTLTTGVSTNDLIHIVITGDTSQNPAGSSYKATMGQVLDLINPTTLTGGTYDPLTGTITFYDDTGGSFNVTGLVTGYTNTAVTGFTYDNANTFTILENDGTTHSASFNIVTGLTVNGSLSATTYLGLPSFSGGSGNCITDFYVTNIYGCSPITIHDSIKSVGSESSGNLSYGYGLSVSGTGDYSVALNRFTLASGDASTAIGNSTSAIGNGSMSQGYVTQSIGNFSHAEGNNCITIGDYSHAEGQHTLAVGTFQHIIGCYNLTATTQSAFIIGNGTSDLNRSNLVFAAGNSFNIYGDLTVTGTTSSGTISATTYQNLPTDVRVTGATYSNNTFTYTNNTGGTFNVLFNSVTGLTVNGNLTVTGNTSLQGLTATTISASTYQNLPTDIRVTGATYSNNTFTYTNNTGGTFNVLFNTITGLTINGNLTVTGNTSLNSTTASTLTLSSVPTTGTSISVVLVRDSVTGVVKQRDITNALNKNYASFYDTGDQTGLANAVLTMSANTSDSWNTGITLSANTRFVIQNPGVYSLAFSGQMVKTGGNTATHAHIWLYQNGLDVPNSASQIGFPSNSVYVVPAWNFFFSTTTPNEYVELKWEINSNVDNQLLLKHQPATGNVPAIPSLIVTINQVN